MDWAGVFCVFDCVRLVDEWRWMMYEERWRGCEGATLRKRGLRAMDLVKLVVSYDLDANASRGNSRDEL